MAKTSCKKGQYYCNTDKKCKPIPEGYTVREDGFLVKEGWSAKYKKSIDCNNPKGFSQKAHCAGKKKKMTEESNPRIARKKGQPAKSKKHSDLYTDEDPKGTIHGLGFKDVATAKASVAKIRKSSRSHAHKIQAAIAMEQRARVMGKTSEAAVYRKFINSMKKKTKAMNEEKHGDHEYEMIRRQADNIMVNAKKLKKKVGKGEGNAKAWVQSKITKAADYLDTAADYMTDKESVKEGTLRSWFKGSKSKDGKGGWVNVKTGGTCASDEPGEGVPKCVSRAKYDSMSKKERESAHRRKRAADPNQQSKTGAAKPTYVSTDKKPKKKKKMKEEFVSLPLQLEVPQSDGEFKCGLMFRESLEQDRGMLFIFESDDYWTFHMKNTFIPLDIAFIKEDGTIDCIKELDPMSPVPVYPDSEIRYAVEVNRGWFAENGVEVGDRILEEAEEINEVKDKKGKGSGTKDACYYKVKSRYSVWPSAYASGALVKCRKVGAANWGNKSESVEYGVNEDLEKIKQGGREYEITKGMSDREYKKHLKKTGNLKDLKKEPYSYKHHSDKKYQGAIKSYDDRIDKSVKDALDKKQAQKDKIEKEYNEKRGGVMKGVSKTGGTMIGVSKDKIGVNKDKIGVKKEHYDWRESFDNEDLDEQLLGAIRKAGSAVGSAVGGAVQKVGSALKSRPIQGRVSRSSQNMAGKPKPATPQATQASPAPQAPQAKPALSDKSPAAKAGIPLSMRQAAADRNAKFQAAKKSGNLAQFRKENPKMSGRERAQQMAKARLAAKKVESSSPTAPKPTVDKVPAKPATPAPKGQDALNRSTTPTKPQDALNRSQQKPGATPAVKGSTATLTGSAGSLQKNKQKANRLASAINQSGGNATVGKISDF